LQIPTGVWRFWSVWDEVAEQWGYTSVLSIPLKILREEGIFDEWVRGSVITASEKNKQRRPVSILTK
jgi:hypothetical protein